MNFENSRTFAEKLDETDDLSSFRQEFLFPKNDKGEEQVYLCGNSLGLQPRAAADYLKTELDDWGKWGVEGHFHGKNPGFITISF